MTYLLLPQTEPDALKAAVHANLNALALRLDHAADIAVEARAAIAGDDLDLSIGTMLPLESVIAECEALARCALQLARVAQAANQNEVSA